MSVSTTGGWCRVVKIEEHGRVAGRRLGADIVIDELEGQRLSGPVGDREGRAVQVLQAIFPH